MAEKLQRVRRGLPLAALAATGSLAINPDVATGHPVTPIKTAQVAARPYINTIKEAQATAPGVNTLNLAAIIKQEIVNKQPQSIALFEGIPFGGPENCASIAVSPDVALLNGQEVAFSIQAPKHPPFTLKKVTVRQIYSPNINNPVKENFTGITGVNSSNFNRIILNGVVSINDTGHAPYIPTPSHSSTLPHNPEVGEIAANNPNQPLGCTTPTTPTPAS